MTKDDFQHELKAHTRLDVAKEIAGEILFSVNEETVRFNPLVNAFTTEAHPNESAEIPTVHGSSWQLLHDVLTGSYDLMQAFSDRDIWTNGYLPVLFRLFAVFQTGVGIRIPE